MCDLNSFQRKSRANYYTIVLLNNAVTIIFIDAVDFNLKLYALWKNLENLELSENFFYE